MLAAVFGEPEGVGGEVEFVRIDWRELQGLGAQNAIAAQWLWLYALDLAGAAIVTRDLAAVDDVRIERVRRGVTVLFDTGGMPVVKGDAAVVTAAADAG